MAEKRDGKGIGIGTVGLHAEMRGEMTVTGGATIAETAICLMTGGEVHLRNAMIEIDAILTEIALVIVTICVRWNARLNGRVLHHRHASRKSQHQISPIPSQFSSESAG